MVDTPFSPGETPTGSGQSETTAAVAAGAAAVPAAVPAADSETVAETPVEASDTTLADPQPVSTDTTASATDTAAPAAAPAAAAPGVASVLEVPPLAAETPAGEGGEWDLLIGKLQAWLTEINLVGQWDRIRGPLKGVAILIAVLIALRAYSAVVGTIASIPLFSGLLELVGAIAFGRFAWDNLLRTQERQKLFAAWQQRWSDFSGRN